MANTQMKIMKYPKHNQTHNDLRNCSQYTGIVSTKFLPEIILVKY